MRAATFLLTRYRAELVPMLVLATIVAVTAFLAAAAPRLLNRVADDGLRHDLGRALSLERNLELGRIGALAGGDGLDSVAAVAPALQAELPETVRGLVSGSTYWAESANWSVIDPPRQWPTWLRFRFPDGVEGRITYVDGRAPTGATTTIPGRRGTIPGEPEDATVFEVALSTEIASTLGVGVGDRLEMQPDTEDVLVGRLSSPVRAAADVVGLYTVDDPADEFWMNDTSLELPTVIVVSPELQLLYGTALLSPDAYRPLIEKGLPARYAWRYFVDPARVDAGMLDGLSADLRQMQTRYPPFVTTMHDADVTTLRTGLLRLIEQFAQERRTAEAVLITTAIGPAAVAIAAVAMVAMLLVHRRRRAVAVARGRGASLAQVVGSHVVEGLVLAAPAAALAFGAASALVDGRASPWSPIAAALVAGGATLVLALTALRPAAAPLRDVEREAPVGPRSSPRRVAIEALVLVLAAMGAVLLRQRGIAGGSAAGQLPGVDPLLAAVPALIGLAIALLTLRLYPLPVRAGVWFADSWRGMVPAFGLRRAARTGDAGSLPLVVLLVTVAIGAFSSTILLTVERGQVAAAWQAVGADLAINAGTRPFTSDFDATTLRGVDAAARMHADTATLGGRGGARVQLHAFDLAPYLDVTSGTGADPHLPAAMTRLLDEGEPIPTILSAAAAASGSRPIRSGDDVELLVASRPVTLRVIEVRDRFPGVDPALPWLVAPLEALRAEIPSRSFSPSTIFIRAPALGAAELQASVEEVFPGTRVIGRAEVLDELRADPLVRGVGTGFVLALLVAIAYAALATTAALVMVAAVRARETAHLRTLGVTPRGLLALALVEHGPAVVAATVVGVALGVGIAWLVAPGLDLAGLIGSPVAVALAIDWSVVGLLVLGLLLVLAVAIALSSWIGRRTGLAAATRQGIE
jgi:putative ABC transport system permease protein